MRSGQLRHIISIQSPQGINDGLGGATSWVDFKPNVRASVEPLSGREYFSAGQMQTKVTHQIKMRWFPGLLESMRVVWGARTFDIKSALDPKERHHEWLVMAEETTEGG